MTHESSDTSCDSHARRLHWPVSLFHGDSHRATLRRGCGRAPVAAQIVQSQTVQTLEEWENALCKFMQGLGQLMTYSVSGVNSRASEVPWVRGGPGIANVDASLVADADHLRAADTHGMSLIALQKNYSFLIT